MRGPVTTAVRNGFRAAVVALTPVILGAAILVIVASTTRPAHAVVTFLLVVVLGARLAGDTAGEP